MAVKVSFPDSVWNGTNRVTQKNANARRAPDRYDYDQVAGELIATQTRVLENSATIDDHEARLDTIEPIVTDHETRITYLESIIIIETSITLAIGDDPVQELFVIVDATSGDIDITLPPPATQRFPITVKRVDASANAVLILPNDSEVIDDETSQTLDAQYDALKVIPDGTNWHVV